MFNNNNFKSNRINPVVSNVGSSTLDSLSYLSNRLQTIKTQICVVDFIENSNNVIFTTVNGEKHRTKSNFSLNEGDKVRIFKNEKGDYEIISVYEKAKNFSKDNAREPNFEYSLPISNFIIGVDEKVLKYISGYLVELEYETSITSFQDNKNQLIPGIKYLFEVISTSSEVDNFGDVNDPLKGVVDILGEILSDNAHIEDTIGAKVVNFIERSTILNTKYGLLRIDENLPLDIGTDLIIKIIEKTPLNKEYLFPYERLEKFISGVGYIANMTNASKKEVISHILAICNNLSVNMYNDGKEAESEKELVELKKIFQELRLIMKEFFCDLGVNSLNDEWFFSMIPIIYDQKYRKQKVFISKGKEFNKIIIDLDLSEIGKLQIEMICNLLANKESPMLSSISTKIKSTEKLSEEFSSFIEDRYKYFMNLSNINGNLVFEIVKQLEIIDELSSSQAVGLNKEIVSFSNEF